MKDILLATVAKAANKTSSEPIKRSPAYLLGGEIYQKKKVRFSHHSTGCNLHRGVNYESLFILQSAQPWKKKEEDDTAKTNDSLEALTDEKVQFDANLLGHCVAEDT